MTKHILLVDDSDDDIELAQQLFQKFVPNVRRSVARDGVQALAMLHAAADPLVPDIILLDLKMPRRDGKDVLMALRANPSTQRIPVIMFTSSCEHSDVQRCYELGANSYVQKPVNFDQYEAALRQVVTYWLELNQLPR